MESFAEGSYVRKRLQHTSVDPSILFAGKNFAGGRREGQVERGGSLPISTNSVFWRAPHGRKRRNFGCQASVVSCGKHFTLKRQESVSHTTPITILPTVLLDLRTQIACVSVHRGSARSAACRTDPCLSRA